MDQMVNLFVSIEENREGRYGNLQSVERDYRRG
jgi:hypothetical protein